MRTVVLCLSLMLLGVPVAIAKGEVKAACKDDAARLCKDVKPGGGRIAACLKEHEADLSQGCKDAIAAKKEAIGKARDLCAPDAERFCKGVRPGRGRIAACLKGHESELSPECKGALEGLKK